MPSSPRPLPRIYLAGPDVFRPDAAAVFSQLKALCAQLGCVGLEPSDGGIAAGFQGTDAELAQRIYDGNIALIRQADGVLANLLNFRGQEPDSGTVFEVGYAIALGKPVAAYGVPAGTYAERVSATTACAPDAAGVLREEASGLMVEGLGQPLNLMLSRSAAIEASAEAALRRLARQLQPALQLRRFVAGDAAALHRVFHGAVHQTASRDYTPAQVQAWAPDDLDMAAWDAHMRVIQPFVVERAGEIVGYADLQPDGLIDHFFVAAPHGGMGVGQLLMDRIHEEAGRLGLAELHADVSLSAEGFFARNGFAVVERRLPVRRGVSLPNARMRKPLAAAPALSTASLQSGAVNLPASTPPASTGPTPESTAAVEATAPHQAPSDVAHPRAIRTFVKRAGRTTAGQAKATTELGPRFVLPYTAQPLDLAAAFERAAPTVLEIGFGMGDATAHIAEVLPETNFLCCEVHEPGVGALLKQIGERGLTNIRILAHDAVEVLDNMLPPWDTAQNPQALAGIHIFFPDPWHKMRHHKRRLIQPAFVARLVQRLAPGGYLHCATDWEPYAHQMLQVLGAEPLLANTAADFAPRPHYRPDTKFERRGLKLGHGVWDLVFQRRA